MIKIISLNSSFVFCLSRFSNYFCLLNNETEKNWKFALRFNWNEFKAKLNAVDAIQFNDSNLSVSTQLINKFRLTSDAVLLKSLSLKSFGFLCASIEIREIRKLMAVGLKLMNLLLACIFRWWRLLMIFQVRLSWQWTIKKAKIFFRPQKTSVSFLLFNKHSKLFSMFEHQISDWTSIQWQ